MQVSDQRVLHRLPLLRCADASAQLLDRGSGGRCYGVRGDRRGGPNLRGCSSRRLQAGTIHCRNVAKLYGRLQLTFVL